MDKNQFAGMWHEVKGKVKEKWGKLTHDDVTANEGSYEKLCGSLQKHYGYSKEVAEEELNSFLKGLKK